MSSYAIEMLAEDRWVRDFDALPERRNRWADASEAQAHVDEMRKSPEYTMAQFRVVAIGGE